MDIDVAKLDHLLTAPKPSGDLILDTRDPQAAARWHPEGHGARYLNVPYDAFESDAEAAVAQLPQDAQNVHVLCARGISAADIAEILRGHGIAAGIVQGGMAAWATYHRVVRVSAPDEAFAIYQVVRPAKGCLSYLVVSGTQALAIDCTRLTDVYRDLAERLGVTLVGIADTHLHADHVSGSSALASGAAPYYLADDDAEGATVARESIPRTIDVGETPIRVLSLPVPGHTLGSTAFSVGGRYLISGDTLLPDGIGRPDLGNHAREWTEHLYDSDRRLGSVRFADDRTPGACRLGFALRRSRRVRARLERPAGRAARFGPRAFCGTREHDRGRKLAARGVCRDPARQPRR
ncbi:MAG TPA: MBL fold metallo-hydrolase [Candidatus Baltobacteraceae bacterium]|jgi:glyoxylase-like metal-dependent hydrolase (beta-lactamase superfamily II)